MSISTIFWVICCLIWGSIIFFFIGSTIINRIRNKRHGSIQHNDKQL